MVKNKKFIGVTSRESLVHGYVFFGGLAIVIVGFLTHLGFKGLLIWR